jgi:hypothetical protein
MFKSFFTILLLFVAAAMAAQKNEFLVYAVKNPVNIVENKRESQLKIGRILRDTATIVIQKGGVVTIICNGVNAFTIRKEGRFTLKPYNDSCKYHEENVLSNYFHYIWEQMYVRSPDNPNRSLMYNAGSVQRGEKPEVVFSPILDTINYAAGPLKIGWQVKNYKGTYALNVFDAASKELVYKKTLQAPAFKMEDLAKSMKPGNRYYWTVSLKGWGESDPKWINYFSTDKVNEFIAGLPDPGTIAEGEAMKLFRIGYMLENAFYLGDAYKYYQQAAKLETSPGVCSDKLQEFKKDLESRGAYTD